MNLQEKLKMQALKSFLPMVLPMLDNLEKPAAEFIQQLKQKYPLQEFEADIVGIISENNNVVVISIYTVSIENKLIRLLESYNLDQLLKLIIETATNGNN